MSAHLIKPVSYDIEDDVVTTSRKAEWLLDTGAEDLADITAAAPGSVAYTADMTYMVQFDGTQWKKIGGE